MTHRDDLGSFIIEGDEVFKMKKKQAKVSFVRTFSIPEWTLATMQLVLAFPRICLCILSLFRFCQRTKCTKLSLKGRLRTACCQHQSTLAAAHLVLAFSRID